MEIRDSMKCNKNCFNCIFAFKCPKIAEETSKKKAELNKKYGLGGTHEN